MCDFLDMHSLIDQWSKQHKSPFRVWFGPILLVFITDAENVEILLKSKDCLSKPETFYKTIKDGLGVDGLVTLKGIVVRLGCFSFRNNAKTIPLHTGAEWKVHRRLVSPTLSQHSVNAHLPVFNEIIRKTITSLVPNSKEFVDILPSIAKCKMTMFIEAALGTSWEPQLKEQYIHQYVAYVSHHKRIRETIIYCIDYFITGFHAYTQLN